MAKRLETHEQLFLLFLQSVKSVSEDIKKKNDELKKNKDYDEVTQLHNTKSIMKHWFNMTGLLPI
jgi:hypothetical protein